MCEATLVNEQYYLTEIIFLYRLLSLSSHTFGSDPGDDARHQDCINLIKRSARSNLGLVIICTYRLINVS